jgi:hypothetical protein
MNPIVNAFIQAAPSIISAATGNPAFASSAALATTAANSQAAGGAQSKQLSPAIQKIGKFFMDHGGSPKKVDLDIFIGNDADLKKAYEELTNNKALKYEGPVYDTNHHNVGVVKFTGDPSYVEDNTKSRPVNPDSQGRASKWVSSGSVTYHHATKEQLTDAYRNYFGIAYDPGFQGI